MDALQRFVPAIPVKDALDDTTDYTAQVCRRNKVLIDYYIYPHPTPTEIEAFEPRLKALEKRIKVLKSINLAQSRQLFDDPDSITAFYLQQIIDQLRNAIFGFKGLFQEHYDPTLAQRNPYANIDERLEEIVQGLEKLRGERKRDRVRHLADNQPATGSIQFCRGAIRLINGHDTGTLNQVHDRDLLQDNRAVLRQDGGTFLWWECSVCNFRLRYHVKASKFSSLESNAEVRKHPNLPMEYRSIFLAKSHLSQPLIDYHSKYDDKYGCVFCFALGKPLERHRTTFTTGRELASHICTTHKSSLPPPVLFVFNVAINNIILGMARKNDLNIRTS